nr:alginate export family protein [Saccharibacter sp. 17.LH.SD]
MGNGEFAGFGPVGVYGVAPWAEDWSDLRDTSRRHDLFDPLKFIALNNRRTIWLSFSGESRVRYWYEAQPRLGTVGHQGAGRLTTRNLLGADLHLGEHIRLFGQLNNGTAAGWRYYGYNATWRRRLGAEQFFVEVKGKIAGAHAGVMVGRQQFLDAPSWLIYNAETPNVPQSWNGIRGYALWNSFRLDAYNFIGTQITRDHIMGGGFDDGTRLYGVDASTALPAFKLGHETVRSFLDLFWMGFRFQGKQAQVFCLEKEIAGTQTRQNIGFRWYGNAPDFEYDFSADYQTGRFFSAKEGGNRPISAYAGRAIVGWRHSVSSLHPFLGVQAEIYSGTRSQRQHGDIEGFVAPFSPRNGTYDVSRTFARSNLMNIGPTMSIAPSSYLTFHLYVPFLWRQRMSDGVYSSSGRYNFLSGRSLRQAGRWVGCLIQASMAVQLTQHLNYRVDGGSIEMSKGMRRAGAKNGTFMLSTLTFRF